MYREYYLGTSVSVEKGTDAVPDDGRYHVLAEGKVVYSTSVLRKARERAKELAGRTDSTPCRVDASRLRQALAREVADDEGWRKEIYWGDSHKFRRKGPRRA